MKARNAAFLEEFEGMPNNYGYTKEEMLIVIKAYDVFTADKRDGKPQQECGWLDAAYDIGPGVFRTTLQTIATKCLSSKMSVFWEDNAETGKIRLSEEGLAFVEQNIELVKSAEPLLGGVSHVRRA